MRKRRRSKSFATTVHRYFPEWADRPVRAGTQWESDRNSYSAGGYAEEFGYAAQRGLPRPAKPLGGDPELSRLWRFQRGAVHPGYPECARPCARDSESACIEEPLDTVQGRVYAEPAPFRVIYVQRKPPTRIHFDFLSKLRWRWKTFGIQVWRLRGL